MSIVKDSVFIFVQNEILNFSTVRHTKKAIHMKKHRDYSIVIYCICTVTVFLIVSSKIFSKFRLPSIQLMQN